MYLTGCKLQDISRVGRRFAVKDDLRHVALSSGASTLVARIFLLLHEPETRSPRISGMSSGGRVVKWLRWSAFGIVSAWLLLCVPIGVVATEAALHPGRRAVTSGDRERAADLAAANHARIRDVSIAGADGAILRAWSIVPGTSNGDAVLLLHGQADNRAGMLGPAALLLRHGYAVLLPDARAHGESGGAVATYGVLEAEDLRRWFEWLRLSENPRCIDGIGVSMGAAELLRSLDAEHGYCAVVAESVFSSFREVAYLRMGQWFGVGSWIGRTVLRPAVDIGFFYARLRYGIDFGQASPIRAVASTGTPVLLIHGLADGSIPPRQSEQIKLRRPSAELWEPANADHCGALSTDPAAYEAQVLSFFAANDLPRGLARPQK
jgi:uncharacterized protein